MCTVKNFAQSIVLGGHEMFNLYFNGVIRDVRELSKGSDSFRAYISTIDNDTILNKKLLNLSSSGQNLCNLSSYDSKVYSQERYMMIYL